MSYILDALKKAERERGISKVPTLSSVHDLRTKSLFRLWAASGVLFVCIAAFLGFYFIFLNSDTDETTPSQAGEAGKAAVQAAEPLNPLPPTRLPASPASQSAAYSQETPALAVETGKEPVDDTGRGPGAARSRMVQSKSGAGIPRPGDVAPRNPPRELAGLEPSPAGVAAPQAEKPKPAVEATGEKLASLREAMDEMTMSILFYSENKAERLVFINGRKYVEGDTIDGGYLLESITPEGAVLSFDGERAILRPERN